MIWYGRKGWPRHMTGRLLGGPNRYHIHHGVLRTIHSYRPFPLHHHPPTTATTTTTTVKSSARTIRTFHHSTNHFAAFNTHLPSIIAKHLRSMADIIHAFSAQLAGEPSISAGSDALVWIDCEMTGLDQDKDEIIEIFCIITTGNLDVVDEVGWGTVIHQSKERMDMMDNWCTRTHAKSGLTAAVLASGVTPEKAADDLLAYVKKYVPNKGVALLAGNSVHYDRAFLRREPYNKVVEHMSHRILDVSAIKEAARRWCPKRVIKHAPTKKALHQARADILESIEEARYYKNAIFGKA